MTTVGSALGRLRGALKGFAYSGLARDRWQHPERVVAALDIRAGQRVADFGAGGGYFTYRLARAVGPEDLVYAVDTDPDMRSRIQARAAREGYGNIVTVEPGSDDPALPEPVELILMVDTFHHLPNESTYFAVLAEMLRPSGRMAVIEALPRWFLFGHATEPDRIRSILTDSGYGVAVKHDFLPRQSFMIFDNR